MFINSIYSIDVAISVMQVLIMSVIIVT